jgi:hypothetical protein
MPYRKSKYSVADNAELELRTIDVLARSQEAITITEIQQQDTLLGEQSSQKMARVLTSLCDMGFITKAKCKSKNRMVYKSVAVMKEQGYEI